MGRTPIQRHAFNAGEIAPELQWRSDLDRYHAGCKVLENFVVMPHGEARRRPGTRFAAHLGEEGGGDFAGEEMRLLPFRFDEDTYFAVLLFVAHGESTATMRIFAPGESEPIVPKAPTPAEDIPGIDEHDVVVAVPYKGSELKEIQFAQINDVLFLAHAEHPLLRLERRESGWHLVRHVMKGGPYQEPNTEPEAEMSLWVENWHPNAAYAKGDCVVDASAVYHDEVVMAGTDVVLVDDDGAGTDVRRIVTMSDDGTTKVERAYHAFRMFILDGIEKFAVGDLVRLKGGSASPLDGYYVVRHIRAGGVYLTQDEFYVDTTTVVGEEDPVVSEHLDYSEVSLPPDGASIMRPLTAQTQAYRALVDVAAGGSPPLDDVEEPEPKWEMVPFYSGRVFAYAKDDSTPFPRDGKFKVRNEASGSFSGIFKLATSPDRMQIKQEVDADSSGWTNSDVSEAFPAFGQVVFRVLQVTEGGGTGWVGKVLLEASEDDGKHWYTLASVQSEGNNGNREIIRNVEKTGTIVRVRCESLEGEKSRRFEFYVDMNSTLHTHFNVKSILMEPEYLAELELDAPVRRLEDTHAWAVGSFNERDGFPRALAVHEERVMLAGTLAEPTTVWGSRINDFEEWQEGTLEASPITFSIASDTYSAIRWVLSKQDLIVGTAESEWAIGSRSTTEALSASSVSARQYSAHGSAGPQAVLAGDRVLFVERGGDKLRGLVYSFDSDSYVAEDLSAFARHISGGEAFAETVLMKSPECVLWCLRGDGSVATMTWEPVQQVLGWARHGFGDRVLTLCTTPGPGTSDTVWMVVKRDGQYCLETLRLDDAVHLDCAVAATDAVRVAELALPPGVEDVVLIAEDVELDEDAGEVEGDYLVDDGVATIADDLDVKAVVAGVRYVSRLETTGHVMEEFAHSGKVRGVSADVYVTGTRGGSVSLDGGASMRPLDIGQENEFSFIGNDPEDEGDDGIGNAAALFTGRVEVPVRTGHQDEITVLFETDTHWPARINAVGVRARRYD